MMAPNIKAIGYQSASVDHNSTMIPRMKASEERDERIKAAAAWRRTGLPLSAAEVKTDLKKILNILITHIAHYQAGANPFMQTPALMLVYIEHVTSFATRDYPREIDEDNGVKALWDAFEAMHIDADASEMAAGAIVEAVRRMAWAARSKASGQHEPAPSIVEIDKKDYSIKPARRLLPGFD